MSRWLVVGLLLLIGAGGGPGLARAQGVPPAEAVCVGLGGDSLNVVVWPATEIAALEAQSGRRVERVHPLTGDCFDPAGLLMVGNRGNPVDWRWDCVRQPDGWLGPVWTATIYIRPGELRAPVDPATGGCPSPAAANQRLLLPVRNAAATAVYISQLEATGDAATLYAWLHPDAQALISPGALAGWYAAEWMPRGPGPLLVDDIRFGGWTWSATGAYYPLTATISYHQAFGDGTVESGEVHLAQIESGAWRWFFGGSPDFLQQVAATYGP